MATLYSNGPAKDYVIRPYQRLLLSTSSVFVASPFVTMTQELIVAASNGKTVRLLAGLNVATDPRALRAAFGIPGLSIRYYTNRFHAKVYLFDSGALVGSSNLTDGGMHSNREATVFIDSPDQLQELQDLSQELWENAAVLTPKALAAFESAIGKIGSLFDPDAKIADAVGRAEPSNISVGSAKKTREYLFLKALERRVHEEFLPAFAEVSSFLASQSFHRPEWSATDSGSETNRFLNWVRLTRGAGDEWQATEHRSKESRREILLQLGRAWVETEDPLIAEDYFENLSRLRTVFSDEQGLQTATRTDLSLALMGVHAFEEQIRFIKGGYAAIVDFFWKENQEDVDRVKRSLGHLVFGRGDYIRRLYEVLHFPEWKIRYFGESCALELSGTVRPELCPPMNGRSAKALHYIGFKVQT